MRLDDYVAHVEKGEIPPGPPVWLTLDGYGQGANCMTYYATTATCMTYYAARATCIKHGMWSVVDLRWTKVLAEWIGDRKVLEIMSGPGWLAKALQIHGVDIIATDNGSWSETHSQALPLYTVLSMDAKEAVEKLGPEADVLLVSWPPSGEIDVCRALEEWGDKPVIYIGEGRDGCGPPGEFWDRFKEMEDVPEFPLMSWDGIHDYVQIGTYV